MSPPKTINKSKISTVFNKDFTPTKLKKIPKKFSVYIPSNLPNNEKPRTVYDRRGLYKYLTQQCPRRREDPPPRSPMTRKPVNSVMWYNNLYTNEEIKASKNKKSDKYKLIEHMKTRKHLSAKQKMEYLNELKSKKKLNNLINKINKFTIPKQNIPTNTENNAIKLESAAVLMNCVNTNASLFKPKRGESEHINTLNGDREWAKLFKKLRTLYLEKLTEMIKLNKKGAAMGSILYRIPLLEKTVLAAEYMENPLFSDFAKEMPKNVKFKIDKNKLYDYIKKNIFTKDGMTRIQIYITQSYYKLIFGKYLTDHKIYINSKDIVRRMKVQGGDHGFYGEVLEFMIREDFDQAAQDLMDNVVAFLNKQILKHKNIKYRNNKFIKKYLNVEPMFNKKEKIVKEIPSTFFPKSLQSPMRKLFINYIRP